MWEVRPYLPCSCSCSCFVSLATGSPDRYTRPRPPSSSYLLIELMWLHVLIWCFIYFVDFLATFKWHVVQRACVFSNVIKNIWMMRTMRTMMMMRMQAVSLVTKLRGVRITWRLTVTATARVKSAVNRVKNIVSTSQVLVLHLGFSFYLPQPALYRSFLGARNAIRPEKGLAPVYGRPLEIFQSRKVSSLSPFTLRRLFLLRHFHLSFTVNLRGSMFR